MQHKILLEKIQSKTAKIAIFGLGYVGLPLAKSFCKQGFSVIGLDPDASKIDILERGGSYLSHIAASEIAPYIQSGALRATTDLSAGKDADAVIICVPTPLTTHRDPDMRYVMAATEVISTYTKPQLISLESTTYPGTVRQMMKPVLEEKRGKSGENFFLAYSPEREDPGNPFFSTHSIPKVVGAESPEALALASALYSLVVPRVIPVSSLEVAESVKLTENIFRWINIGMVNELKMIFQEMGVDIWEVIDAAATKPFGYMPFYPGPGVGGHCIPVDPLYLSWKIRSLGLTARFIDLASQVNEEVGHYIIGKIAEGLDHVHSRGFRGSQILLLGVTYKKNVNDCRESPALSLFHKLVKKGADVSYHDPFIGEINTHGEYPELDGKKSVDLTIETLKNAHVVVLCTDHDYVDYSLIVQKAALVIDTRNVIKDRSHKHVMYA